MNQRLHSLRLCENSLSLWWRLVQLFSSHGHRVSLRHRDVFAAVIFSFACVTFSPVTAQTAQPLEDPAIEARMKNLTKQLRCLVCQNETLADSQAQLAEDLRQEIREQIRAGKSDQEIMAYVSQRYTDFVLYN